jgi:hypothetical protein
MKHILFRAWWLLALPLVLAGCGSNIETVQGVWQSVDLTKRALLKPDEKYHAYIEVAGDQCSFNDIEKDTITITEKDGEVVLSNMSNGNALAYFKFIDANTADISLVNPGLGGRLKPQRFVRSTRDAMTAEVGKWKKANEIPEEKPRTKNAEKKDNGLFGVPMPHSANGFREQ